MNKTTQDLAWSVLPKEFKEEVKKLYREFTFTREGYYKELFGRRNLISDAEGEEILTVSRKRVLEMYAANERIKADFPDKETAHISDHINHALKHLFGSKCLPDETPLSQKFPENCDNGNHISNDCDKPAEPKFKIGDKVRYRPSGEVYEVEGKTGRQHYALKGWITDIVESDLEPYTEPTDFGREVNFPTKNNLAIYLKKSKNCDNRLQIAAMAMQGILSNENAIQYAINNFRLQDGSRNRYQAVAECSLAFADALIAESEKRSEHGK